MENQLDGKNIIVTGANCGIGYEAALELAKRGARVILACRDEKKAQDACNKIKEESKNDKVEVELLDLSKLKSIKAFSERIISKLDKLDILINNAGLTVYRYIKTEDGFESSFMVNYLGPYYLTRLLLNLIKQSAPSRIINVSSTGHKGVTMNWDDLQSEKSFSGFFAYRQSKLGNNLFTVELAERLKGTNVTVVSLHPGTVKTEILRTDENDSFFSKLIVWMARPFFIIMGLSSAQGALTTIHCATDDDVPNHSGAYYETSKISQASLESTNMETAKKLWTISAQLCGLND